MSEQAQVPDEVAVQPSLPDFELPEMEGVKPVGVVTSLNGSGERIQRAMHYGERGVLVVEYECSQVGLKKTSQGPKRAHTLNVLDLYELPGKPGAKLLRSLRTAYRLADDARLGRRQLDVGPGGDVVAGVEVATDGSGVVMTPGERGSLAGLGLPDVDAFVLVFEGGQRALWPDEFEDTAALGGRPGAGDQLTPPGGKDEQTVRQVLDVDTGETLEEWTDEQEDARLLALEQQLEEEERAAAAGDREAFQELEAARGNVVEGPFSEPWEGYENATVSDVEARLVDMTDVDDVFAVAAYEERHGARKGVLKACTKRAADLEASES